jgi:hypothetical protein
MQLLEIENPKMDSPFTTITKHAVLPDSGVHRYFAQI